jgi:hypothetical protein
VASKPARRPVKAFKGTSSEPNVVSTPEAQHVPPLSRTIDVTKPLNMILPDPQPQTVNISSSSSSSDFEDTLSDSSSETLEEIIRKGPKLKTKTPFVKEFSLMAILY